MPPRSSPSRSHVAFGRVARLAAAHARALTASLAPRSRWANEDIHQARVLCKKLRAVVHLGRGLITKKQRREWNEHLAQAARALSGARDASILKGWMEVAALNADASIAKGIPAVIAKLGAAYPRRLPTGARALVLETLGALADEWSSKWGPIYRTPTEGLRRMNQRVRSAAEDALENEEPETWHIWRRRVKYAAYQLEWIALAKEKKPGARYRHLRQLGSALGKFNDMNNLATWLDGTRSKSLATRYLQAWAEEAGQSWKKKAREAWKNVR